LGKARSGPIGGASAAALPIRSSLVSNAHRHLAFVCALASLRKQGVAEAAPTRSEVVAGCGASDGSPYQPAPAHSERRKHVFATGAPHLASGSGSVVRLRFGQPPDPHVIRPPWKPRPGGGIACLAASRNGRRCRRRVPTRTPRGRAASRTPRTLPILPARRL
jgi:hypothetical protein